MTDTKSLSVSESPYRKSPSVFERLYRGLEIQRKRNKKKQDNGMSRKKSSPKKSADKEGHAKKRAKNERINSQNTNQFSRSKHVLQSIADVSLLMANISQLRAVTDIGNESQFKSSLLTLLILSLLSHILFVIFSIIRSHYKRNHRIIVQRASIGNLKAGDVTYCCCLTKTGSPQFYNDNDLCTCPHCHTDLYLSYVCYLLVFITVTSNIGITGIGIS